MSAFKRIGLTKRLFWCKIKIENRFLIFLKGVIPVNSFSKNETFSSGLEYEILADGNAVICGIGSCKDSNILIPRYINRNIQVVGIADKAFFKSKQIKSIKLPSSVSYIGNSAFAWCHNLISIHAPAITSIADRAFMGCDLLCVADIGNDLTSIGEKAFAYCTTITNINLPDHVHSIGVSAFEGCRNLRCISLPEDLKIIENGIFYACTSLRKVDLPKKLEYIDEYAFAYCVSINELNIPKRTVINNDAFYECGNAAKAIKVS